MPRRAVNGVAMGVGESEGIGFQMARTRSDGFASRDGLLGIADGAGMRCCETTVCDACWKFGGARCPSLRVS